MVSWRSRPPSQYSATKGRVRFPHFWSFVLTGLICLAVGLGGGLALAGQDGSKLVSPTKRAAKREHLTSRENGTLGVLTTIDGTVLLGKERRDVCATARGGWTAKEWYASGCGIEVTWYLAAKGSPRAVKRAVRARMERQHVPRVSDFTWTKNSGPLPRKPSGQVRAVDAHTKGALTHLKRGRALSFPKQGRVYHDRVTSFDLASAYQPHRHDHPVLVRVSLVAQYAWT